MLPPIGFPVEFDFSLNADVLGFTVLLCCAGSLLTGLAPALHSVRSGLMDSPERRRKRQYSGAGQNRHARAAGGLGGGAGAGGAGRHGVVRAELSKRAGYSSRLRREQRTVRAVTTSIRSAQNTEQRAQFCCRLRDRVSGAVRYRRGELRGTRAAGDRQRTALGHTSGRIRSALRASR